MTRLQSRMEKTVSRHEQQTQSASAEPLSLQPAPSPPPTSPDAGQDVNPAAAESCQHRCLGRCLIIPIEGMQSRRCERIINRMLKTRHKITGWASYAAGVVRIESTNVIPPLAELADTLAKRGYRLLYQDAWPCGHDDPTQPTAPCHDRVATKQKPGLINRLLPASISAAGAAPLATVLVGGLLLAIGFVLRLTGQPMWAWIPPLAIAAVLTSLQTFPSAVRSLLNVTLDVDVLMFVAAAGATWLGHAEEGVFLLFLFGLGTAGEHMALGRARHAIEALRDVAPENARLIDDDGNERMIPAANVRIDDQLLVLPFERFPADGAVIAGRSAVDQAAITGESIPVEKDVGDIVFAGSINGDSQILFRATRPAGDSTLSRLIRLVEVAETEKSPAQQLTDRVERWYVPTVLALTIAVIVIPPLAWNESWSEWFYRAMAFLTAASPCAIAIGGPAAVLCGIARSARIGVLIKGGGPLETLGRVRAVCFDKTGTLTAGKPRVTNIVPLTETVTPDQALAWAASIEAETTHPLAAAIVTAARDRNLTIPDARDVRQITGMGAEGYINDDEITVGRLTEQLSARMTDAQAQEIADIAAQGRTIVCLTRNGEPLAVFGIADEPRPEAKETVAELRRQGMTHVSMLTGDRQAVAEAIAARLGIDRVYADLMPEDKLRAIEELSNEHETAMVGDGVNDAPALARADVGIAVGGAGADVAMETADVVLMGQTIERLPDAIAISRLTRSITFQNLVIALGVIAVVAPMAVTGHASLGIAVLLHEGSTVVVVLNALRILRWGRKRK